jgi:hypothetical protein
MWQGVIEMSDGKRTTKTNLTEHLKIDANNTPVQLTTGEARIMDIDVVNTDTEDRWLQLFDQTATPVMGTTTPVLSYMIPAASSGTVRGSFSKSFDPSGLLVSNSCWYALATTPTGGAALSTAAVVNILYEEIT